jgi:Flp pilus assembly protein TadG
MIARATKFLDRLTRDRRGVTLVEFAFVAPPLMLILLGLTDFGYRSYVASVVEGTVHRAARQATVGDKTSSQIDDWVKTQLSHFSDNGVVTINKTNYYQFSHINKTESLTKDTNGNGVADSGDCWLDVYPGNPTTGPGLTGRDGLGGSDDIVYYEVSLQYPRVVPMGSFLGWADSQTITAMTVMRNQPYASQVQPVEACKP